MAATTADGDSFDALRSPELLSVPTSRLVLIDVQQRLTPVVMNNELLVQRCDRLLQAARILSVPIDVTEQYPKGLGHTVEALAEFASPAHEKLRFSAASVLPWAELPSADTPVEPDGRDQIVLAGIETHICVLQTALDLISRGFRVFVPADAVSSRHEIDTQHGLTRLRDSGVTITTTEAILFEWCEIAGTDEFKQISRLVR